MQKFKDFPLDPKILQALEEINYQEATHVQAATIPLALKKRDMIVLAETGSGKTAACAIPVCEAIDEKERFLQALILVPTRELAMQYATEAQKIGTKKNVKVFAICGGEDMELQKAKLSSGVHLCIATPGRLIDLIYNQSIRLDKIKLFVLDEADKMLSMGFIEDLEFIMDCLIQKVQILLFSATMPKEIIHLAKKKMHDPVKVKTSSGSQRPQNIQHLFDFCSDKDKHLRFKHLMKEFKPQKSMIFCRSRKECERLCSFLKKHLVNTDFLHGGLNQKIRNSITGRFRAGNINHLVVTDVASRGLDFSAISHVFIYTLSKDPDNYVHRSGRTGRYNREGTCISLISKKDLDYLKKILKSLNLKAKWINHPPSPVKRRSS